MHYLTQYYKNRCNQLQEQINSLNGKLYMLAEAAVASNSSTETADQSGGFGNTRPFSGANLGQLLGSNNMDAVHNYMAQYYANNPAALRAIAAMNQGQASGGADSGAGVFDGANLGRILGANDPSGARRYVGQFGGGSDEGAQTAPGMRSMLRAATNKAAGVRGGSIGGGEMAGGYGGGASPYGEAGGAADSGAFGGGSNGGGGFSGEVLGQLLGNNDMGAVANYLQQFKGYQMGAFGPKNRRRS